MVSKLSDTERSTHLPKLQQQGWALVKDRDALTKSFTFSDFNAAWGFMSRVALKADKVDHHPEWFNVYNRVDVTWSTHDCQGLSERDLKMVAFCEEVASAKH